MYLLQTTATTPITATPSSQDRDRRNHEDDCVPSRCAAATRTCFAQWSVASVCSSQNALPTPNALHTCGSSTSDRYTPFPALSSVERSASSFGSLSTSAATKPTARAAVPGGQCNAADSNRFANAAARQDGGAADAERGANASSSARKRMSAGECWDALRGCARTGVGAISMSGWSPRDGRMAYRRLTKSLRSMSRASPVCHVKRGRFKDEDGDKTDVSVRTTSTSTRTRRWAGKWGREGPSERDKTTHLVQREAQTLSRRTRADAVLWQCLMCRSGPAPVDARD